MSALGHKALTCLDLARRTHDYKGFPEAWDAACELYHPKQIELMCQRLVDRGYMECGVSARTGWLTQKGRDALVGFERSKP